MQLSSRTYDADDIAAVQELYHSNGWTDGLPIVPPTADAVQACLDWAMMPPDQLIGIEPVRGLAVTAEKLAINAVMAGCLPMHFPVVAHRLDGDDAGRLPDAWRHGQHRRLRRAGGAERADPARARRQRRLQCAGQQRSRDGRDRPRHPALPDQPDGRAAGRHRPLDPGPSRQVQLLRGRGRGGHDLAVARRAARHPEGGLGGHGDGGGRAAPDHERVDDQARGDPGDLRRRDARQPAALLDPSRQLRADHSQAAARAPAGGEVEQDRHRQLHP